MISQSSALDKVPTSESIPDPLSMREIFTWEIAAMVSLLLVGLTLQIGGELLGVVVHQEVNNGAHSTPLVSPNCSDGVVTQ